MKQKILIVAAPFGFGPIVKALALAHKLKVGYDVTIFTSGAPAEFLSRHIEPGVSMLDGRFSVTFARQDLLLPFHRFICVGQLPALNHIISAGLGQRAIFIDSTSQWRQQVGDELLPASAASDASTQGDVVHSEIAAYIIEDELPELDSSRSIRADALVVSPILWETNRSFGTSLEGHIVFHTGGLLSPSAHTELVRLYIHTILLPLLQALSAIGIPVIVIGPLSSISGVQHIQGVTFAGEIHPYDSYRLIASAELLVTTPGFGAVYEALSTKTPVMVLPPTNSTQIQHYRLWLQHGMTGLMDPFVNPSISQNVLALPWPQHANALLHLLAKTAAVHVAYATNVLNGLLGTGFKEYCASAGRLSYSLWGRLSKIDPVAVIQKKLNEP